MGAVDSYHAEDFFYERTHQLTFSNLSPNTIEDILTNGFRIFMFCDGIVDSIASIFQTVLLFAGGLGKDPNDPIFGSHVPEYMEKANVNFLKQTMGWQLQERPIQEVTVDKSMIKSGDFLMVYRLDGLDQLIMYGTGSHVGHATMALWMDDDLYIVESQDGWYWPKSQIQRNKFDDWI